MNLSSRCSLLVFDALQQSKNLYMYMYFENFARALKGLNIDCTLRILLEISFTQFADELEN